MTSRAGTARWCAGTLRDRSATDTLPAALAAMLRGFGVPRESAVSLTRAVPWP